MSRHLDSPRSRRDPRPNLTDRYLVTADRATVLRRNVGNSLGGPQVPVGCRPRARVPDRLPHAVGQPAVLGTAGTDGQALDDAVAAVTFRRTANAPITTGTRPADTGRRRSATSPSVVPTRG